MANSVYKNLTGPFWPLGNIVVPTPGTPVSIMSLVDPSSLLAPETPTSPSNPNWATVRFQQIFFAGLKANGATSKLTNNAGNVYLVLKALAGAGGTQDVGVIIKTIIPGETFYLGSSALNRNVFGPYELYIDADTPNDGCQVTGLIQ